MTKKFTLFMALLCVCCFASAVDYLTFTAEEDNSSFYPELKAYFEENTEFANDPPSIQYSLDDGKTWTEFQFPKGEPVVLAKKGDKALLRGQNPYGISPEYQHYVQFVMTGSIAASGNIMTLVDTTGKRLSAPSFEYLFKGCTSLTKAPDLPATTLGQNCYMEMFSGCTNLTQAPEILPATQGAYGCYLKMFEGCTSLTKSPELFAVSDPAYDGDDDAYASMFKGCTSLSEITVHFTKWPDNYNWVAGVVSTGTFNCPNGLPLKYGANGIPEGWTVNRPANYLTFTAEEDSSSFKIIFNEYFDKEVLYSLDNGEAWDTLTSGVEVLLPKKGDKALLRGNNPNGFSNPSNHSGFRMSGAIAASGSVMTLVDNKGQSLTIPSDLCFCNLFVGCTSLTQAPELPATQLTKYCYKRMFEGCTSLKEAPELPATTMEEECYAVMFGGCTSLAQAPELPATKLSKYCYMGMFEGCTSLKKASELPATELDTSCYRVMFRDCSSLTEAPKLPATTMVEDCYAGLFSGCSSLTQAPELPATELADNCYEYMFYNCSSLTKAPELPATELAGGHVEHGCYMGMFNGCSNLSYIKVNFTQWPEIYYIFSTRQDEDVDLDEAEFGWVTDVAPTGTFVCPSALPKEYGPQRIPEGWTVEPTELTGTDDFSSTDCSVWTENLSLFVRGAEGLIEVYDLNGKLLRSAQCKENETVRFVLPGKGTYVVKTETKSVKIMN